MSVILIKVEPEIACICKEKNYITKLDNIVGKFLEINNNVFLK